MVCKIFENGEEINRIVADESFCATYCAENGYTYEVEPDPPAPDPEEPEISITDRMLAHAYLEGVQGA